VIVASRNVIMIHSTLTTPFSGAAMLLVATLLSACANYETTPNVAAGFGDASRAIRAQQVVDPSAPTRNATLSSTDGKVTAGAQKAFAESHGYTVKEGKAPVLEIPTQGKSGGK
jgi:hypothetical protein